MSAIVDGCIVSWEESHTCSRLTFSCLKKAYNSATFVNSHMYKQQVTDTTRYPTMRNLAFAVLPCALIGLSMNQKATRPAQTFSSANANFRLPVCGSVRIEGHKGPLESFVNGLYSVDVNAPLINDRVSLQKVRSQKDNEPRPDLFLMFQNSQWFIAFFAPGQGKQMTALASFNSDVDDPSQIDAGLNVAGTVDFKVRVVCVDTSGDSQNIEASCSEAMGECS